MPEPSPIEIYESHVADLSDDCADPWFKEQLARYRTGDEKGLRSISERCLGRVLAIAKKHWRPDSHVSLLDAVQEGNGALVKAIEHCRATTSDEFLQQMTTTVESAIVLVLQHPGQT